MPGMSQRAVARLAKRLGAAEEANESMEIGEELRHLTLQVQGLYGAYSWRDSRAGLGGVLGKMGGMCICTGIMAGRVLVVLVLIAGNPHPAVSHRLLVT